MHDARTLAVVLAHDQHGAAGDATRGQVGQRVRRHIGAHSRFERDRTAQRVIDRGGQSGGGGSFRGAVLEMHPQLLQYVVGVGQHIHQVRDRRTLVARHIRHARLQQGLGDGQNALAMELVAIAQAKFLHLLHKRAFSHAQNLSWGPCPVVKSDSIWTI